jgi:hypothetical protein
MRWWTGLQVGYGLTPQGVDFQPIELTKKDYAALLRAVAESNAPTGGEYQPEFK